MHGSAGRAENDSSEDQCILLSNYDYYYDC